MDYISCVEYMENLSKFGSVFGLDTIKNFLDKLGRPQDLLKIVNVGGTNGKGSTCAYLTKILSVSGYKVGTFNSPSVFSYNERFLINGKVQDDDLVLKYLSIVIEKRNELENAGEKNLPTSFELELAAALLMFKDENCDIVILEAGMGGRLDATNFADENLLTIITSIDFDHIEYLGNTLSKIANEKFGLVKDTLITFKQDKEIMKIFKKAKNLYVTKDAKLIFANLSGITFKYGHSQYKLKMLGLHQIQNASLAILAAKKLKTLGYDKIDNNSIKKGLYLTSWPGRCEKIECKNKVVILDGAHNPSGAKTLKDAITLHLKNNKKSYVFGVFKDKDAVGILNNMKEVLDTMYIAKAPTKRAMELSNMKNICEKYSNNVITNASIKEALKKALEDDSDVIIVFGSLSILNEAKTYLRGINGQE